MRHLALLVPLVAFSVLPTTLRAELLAGVAKVDITDREAGPVNDPLFVRALVVKSGDTSVVIVTVDAVAIGGIGRIKDEYLGKVRGRLQRELGLDPARVVINASHCHGVVRLDYEDLTIQAIQTAARSLTPVRVGVGTGHESRISENRRLKLKSGREADVRHAYALPPDEQVAEAGPIDPQIGVLRLDRTSGGTLAVVYNFACHPIQGVPGAANTADITGFSSKVIEEQLGTGGVALFVQGCGGDINPVWYKDVDHPRNAEPLGNMLGLSTLQAVHKITCQDDSRLQFVSETIALPRGDRTERIVALETEQKRLLASLRGTTLNLKTFVPLLIKYRVNDEFPSYNSHRYLHDQHVGRDELTQHDAANRRALKAYIDNILVMEELTRVQTNLALLRKHQVSMIESGKRTIDVELTALRIGDWVLTTFPGELTVRIGLGIKQRSPHPHTFVAGYTNGYIYYAPTAEQLRNLGGAQEDSDCVLAPEWQEMYERKVAEILKRL